MNTLVTGMPVDREPWLRRHETLLLAALGGTAGADFLFWNAPVGCSLAIFAGGLLAILLLTGGTRRAVRNRSGVLLDLVAVILGLCISFVEEPTIIGFLLCGIALAALALHQHDLLGTTPGQWGAAIARFIMSSPLRIVMDSFTTARWAHRNSSGTGVTASRSVRRWVLPALLGGVFLCLFGLANPIVSNGISRAVDWVERLAEDLPQLFEFARVLFWLIVMAGVYALLRPRVRTRLLRMNPIDRAYAAYMAAEPPPLPGTIELPAPASPGLIIRCLLACNVVFAMENGLDATYLFGGFALPSGMTYAAYAHRGSYPLVAAALLAAMFILVAFRAGGPAERSRVARWLVFAWLAQTVFLTLSAILRLDLYVDAYSLTRLRLAAGIWMVIVSFGLLWIFCRILLHRSNAWLLSANVFTTLAILFACSFIDVNGGIAKFNVAHCREVTGTGPAIDLAYLRELGPDALPAVRQLLPALHSSCDVKSARDCISHLGATLDRELLDWRGWTWRRQRLQNADGVTGGHPAASERATPPAENRNAYTIE